MRVEGEKIHAGLQEAAQQAPAENILKRNTPSKSEISMLGIDNARWRSGGGSRNRRNERVEMEDVVRGKNLFQLPRSGGGNIETVTKIGVEIGNSPLAEKRKHFPFALAKEHVDLNVGGVDLRGGQIEDQALDTAKMRRPKNVQNGHSDFRVSR
jgi:hypothetical protein